MFDSPVDWIIIIAIVLILFGGAKKIPEFARSLGKASGEFNRGKLEIERELKSSFATTTASSSGQSSNLHEAAKNLGIDPANKTDDDLRREMSEKLKN
ncbi:MAG: twin-arginine translocase TatA/TatE family subunit [Candidatus Thermoplasmatota archaeon]|jgi:sec-independent protein translocase protein TatA|nr:twin-arginine translocase TatA/TatE family subunit [Candidatus Thermoplasmatota archaeon]